MTDAKTITRDEYEDRWSWLTDVCRSATAAREALDQQLAERGIVVVGGDAE